ncbi:MAG: hypothetical protein ACYDHH_12305 [Solirubrobacteraceae bacterium]
MRAINLVFDHGANEFFLTFTAPAYRFSTDYAQLAQTLRTWRWQ